MTATTCFENKLDKDKNLTTFSNPANKSPTSCISQQACYKFSTACTGTTEYFDKVQDNTCKY